MPPLLYGATEPRFYTPPLRPLTPETSLGFECATFLEEVVGMKLYPWQHWLLQHMLELEPGPKLAFRFRTVIVLIARQNGKTTILKGVALYFMYVLSVSMVIGTAQNLDVSEETWEATLELAESVEELAAEIPVRGGVSRVNGKKFFRLRSGERYKVAAASRRGGRGFTGNLILMDELREHQSWDSWSAVTKTTMAVLVAMVVAASNAGDAASIVLRHLRKIALVDLAKAGDQIALAELDDPALTLDLAPAADDDVDLDQLTADDSLGLFEWSAPPKSSIWDTAGWIAANPSLGHNPGFTAANIRSAVKTDPEWTLRTEVLCQWRPTAGGGPFPDGEWEAGIDDASQDDGVSDLGIGLAAAADGGVAYVAVAGPRADGHVHVEVIARRAGTEWVLPWLLSPERATRPRWAAVAWQVNGAPVSALTDDLRAAGKPLDDWRGEDDGLRLVDWSGPALTRASGVITELVRLPKPDVPADAGKRRLFHPTSPVLDVPATSAAVRTSGDSWLLDLRKSPTDAAPLQAVFAAVWALSQVRPSVKPSRLEWV